MRAALLALWLVGCCLADPARQSVVFGTEPPGLEVWQWRLEIGSGTSADPALAGFEYVGRAGEPVLVRVPLGADGLPVAAAPLRLRFVYRGLAGRLTVSPEVRLYPSDLASGRWPEGEPMALALPPLDQAWQSLRRGGWLVVVALLGLGAWAGAAWLGRRRRAHQVLEEDRLLERLRQPGVVAIEAGKEAAVGQLAAGVAHEINTPLAALTFSLERAVELLQSNPSKATDRLEKAVKAVERVRGITDKLLYYSRDASGQQAELDLATVAADSLELVGQSLREAGVTVRFEAVPCPVRGDANQLQQVILALLDNARRAALESARPEILVRITASRLASLEVHDYGAGLEPDVLARAFEPFYTTQPVGAGLGLGLSLGRQIMVVHQGTLTLTSTPGQGTCALMTLPKATGASG